MDTSATHEHIRHAGDLDEGMDDAHLSSLVQEAAALDAPVMAPTLRHHLANLVEGVGSSELASGAVTAASQPQQADAAPPAESGAASEHSPTRARRGKRLDVAKLLSGERNTADESEPATAGSRRRRASSAGKKAKGEHQFLMQLLQQPIDGGDGLDLGESDQEAGAGGAPGGSNTARRRRSRVAVALRGLVEDVSRADASDTSLPPAASGVAGGEGSGDAAGAGWVGFAGRTLPDAPLFGRADKTSRYRGVSWDPQKRQYKARVYHEGREMCIGHFNTEEEAARARDQIARQIQGKSARLNFPANGEGTRPRVPVSRFRGVSWQPTGQGAGMWRVRIFHDGNDVTLGYFQDEEDAARAYDRKALELKGPDCKLNFPHDTATTMAMQFRKTTPEDDAQAVELLDMLSRGQGQHSSDAAESAGQETSATALNLAADAVGAEGGAESRTSLPAAGKKQPRSASVGEPGARKARSKRPCMVRAEAGTLGDLAADIMPVPSAGASAASAPAPAGETDVPQAAARKPAARRSLPPGTSPTRAQQAAAEHGAAESSPPLHDETAGGPPSTYNLVAFPPGVRWRTYKSAGPRGGTWEVRLHHRGKSFYVGSFASPEDAIAAHRQASTNLASGVPLQEGIATSGRAPPTKRRAAREGDSQGGQPGQTDADGAGGHLAFGHSPATADAGRVVTGGHRVSTGTVPTTAASSFVAMNASQPGHILAQPTAQATGPAPAPVAAGPTVGAPGGPVARQSSSQAIMDAASGLHMLAQAFDLEGAEGGGGQSAGGTVARAPMPAEAAPSALPKPTIHFPEAADQPAPGSAGGQAESWSMPTAQSDAVAAHTAAGTTTSSAFGSDMSYFSAGRGMALGTPATGLQGLSSSLGTSPPNAGSILLHGGAQQFGLMAADGGYFAMPIQAFGPQGYASGVQLAPMNMSMYGYPSEFAPVMMGMGQPMQAYMYQQQQVSQGMPPLGMMTASPTMALAGGLSASPRGSAMQIAPSMPTGALVETGNGAPSAPHGYQYTADVDADMAPTAQPGAGQAPQGAAPELEAPTLGTAGTDHLL